MTTRFTEANRMMEVSNVAVYPENSTIQRNKKSSDKKIGYPKRNSLSRFRKKTTVPTPLIKYMKNSRISPFVHISTDRNRHRVAARIPVKPLENRARNRKTMVYGHTAVGIFGQNREMASANT